MATKDKAPAFQWYPKDILSDGRVEPMSLECEGAYRRLLDFCWLEKRLPDDMDALASYCKHISIEKMREMWTKIAPCFTRVEDGGVFFFTHPRLDKEREHQAKNRRGRKLAAKARWKKLHDAVDANALQMQCSSTPTPTASPTPTPVCTEKSADAPPRPTPKALMEVWNRETQPPIPRCKELSATRSQHARVRLAERSLEEWAAVCQRIQASAFCRGEGDTGWVATFDWLLKPDTATRVLEGKYDNRAGNQGGGWKPPQD